MLAGVLHAIIGSPGSGKSSFAYAIALALASANVRVCIYNSDVTPRVGARWLLQSIKICFLIIKVKMI